MGEREVPDAHIARLNEDLQMQVVDLEEYVSKLRAEVSCANEERSRADLLAEKNIKLLQWNESSVKRVSALEGEKAQLAKDKVMLENEKADLWMKHQKLQEELAKVMNE